MSNLGARNFVSDLRAGLWRDDDDDDDMLLR